MTWSFSNEGISFTVYGDEEGEERIIPVDCLPRVLSGAEWGYLETGLAQRVKALNLFLEDVYGEARIIDDGVIPTRHSVRVSPIPHGDARFFRTPWRLGCYLWYGPGADQRWFSGAGGQPASPFRRFLHDRESKGGEGQFATIVPELAGAGGGAVRTPSAGDAS